MGEEINLLQPSKVSMKNNPNLNEIWLQDIIANNPAILGLGDDIVMKDKERIQPSGGRLDILLQDIDTNKRYEVEIQLGKTDESHIIRTIEYWDIERKRYPQYEHCAVIIAEEITSRFLNVISLFNGTIPLIAIQVNAYQLKNDYMLTFNKILDEVQLGLVDEDEETKEVTDRNYWLERGTVETVKIADDVLKLIKEFDEKYEFKYNKFYIGLAKNNQPDNFAILRPQKKNTRIEVRLKKDEALESKFDEWGLQWLDYQPKNKRYRIILNSGDVKKCEKGIRKLIQLANGSEEKIEED